MVIGGGGSRTARHIDFSNNLNKTNRYISEIREKAEVQVQNRYSGLLVGDFCKALADWRSKRFRGKAGNCANCSFALPRSPSKHAFSPLLEASLRDPLV